MPHGQRVVYGANNEVQRDARVRCATAEEDLSGLEIFRNSAITDVPRRNGLAKRPERGQVAECCHTSGLASSLKNHRCVQRFCAKTSEISK
jgi:hypothetical protein